MAGSVISVIVTIDDEEYTDSTKKVTGEDKSAEVSIIDQYGAQDDGTGIVGDRLALTYGVDFGTPTYITWYRDGSVVATMGQGGTNLNADGGLYLDVTAARGTGVYKAVVVADGIPYTTNEFTISSAEDQAEIQSFGIADDYTVDGGVVFAAKDTQSIVTIKMNKNYQGQFGIYKATDKKYSTPIDTLTTAPYNAAPTQSADAVTSAAAGASVAATTLATGKDILSKTPGSGLAYIANNGEVTYKWYSDQLVRGTEYVLVFDQGYLTSDNVGRGSENVYADSAIAPYVTKPTKAEITKLVANAPIEITFYTSDTEVMTFAGVQTAIAGPDAIGAKTGSAIYSGTKTGLATGDATKHAATLTTGGSLKAGVWTSDVSVTGTNAFWFANIVFNKGIYGKDEFTLRTADAQVAQDAAGAITVEYSASSPNDLTVKFTNLRTAGTVYIANLGDSDGGTAGDAAVSDETAADGYARVYADTTLAITSQDVAVGADKVVIKDVVAGINNCAGATACDGNSYIAFFVPDDEENYSPVYTTTKADVTAKLVSYTLGGTKEGNVATLNGASGANLRGKDQFGNGINSGAITAFNLSADIDSNTDVVNVPTIAVAAGTANGTAGGAITVDDATTATVNYVTGSTFSATLATGQTIKLSVKTGAAAGSAVFTISLA